MASRWYGREGERVSTSVLLLLLLLLPLLGGGGLATGAPGGLPPLLEVPLEAVPFNVEAGVTVVTFRLMRNLSANSPIRKPWKWGAGRQHNAWLL